MTGDRGPGTGKILTGDGGPGTGKTMTGDGERSNAYRMRERKTRLLHPSPHIPCGIGVQSNKPGMIFLAVTKDKEVRDQQLEIRSGEDTRAIEARSKSNDLRQII